MGHHQNQGDHRADLQREVAKTGRNESKASSLSDSDNGSYHQIEFSVLLSNLKTEMTI